MSKMKDGGSTITFPYNFRTESDPGYPKATSHCFYYISWRARLGSNQQPLPSEGSTLNAEISATFD